jgi:hypothetical protein
VVGLIAAGADEGRRAGRIGLVGSMVDLLEIRNVLADGELRAHRVLREWCGQDPRCCRRHERPGPLLGDRAEGQLLRLPVEQQPECDLTVIKAGA